MVSLSSSPSPQRALAEEAEMADRRAAVREAESVIQRRGIFVGLGNDLLDRGQRVRGGVVAEAGPGEDGGKDGGIVVLTEGTWL